MRPTSIINLKLHTNETFENYLKEIIDLSKRYYTIYFPRSEYDYSYLDTANIIKTAKFFFPDDISLLQTLKYRDFRERVVEKSNKFSSIIPEEYTPEDDFVIEVDSIPLSV